MERAGANRFHIKVDKKSLIWFLMMACLLECAYFDESGGIIDNIFTIGKLACAAFIFLKLGQIRLIPFEVLVILFYGIEIFSTFINSGISVSDVLTCGEAVVYVVLIGYMMNSNQRRTINVLAFIFEILVYINFTTILAFPNGLYNINYSINRHYYLLGHQNEIAVYILIAVVLSLLRDNLNHNDKKISFRSCLLLIVSMASAIKVWSVVSIVSIFALVALITWIKVLGNKIPVPMVFAVPSGLVLFLAVVVFQLTSIIEPFVVGVLRRDISFSKRTVIWQAALKQVVQHPWLGIGLGKGGEIFGFTTAHNRYLNILFVGGAVLLLVWLAIQFTVYKRCDKMKQEWFVQLLESYFWVLTVTTQFETYGTLAFLTLFAVASRIKREDVQEVKPRVKN